MNNVNMAVRIGKLEMKNPVTTASGTFGSGALMTDYVDLNRLGAITIKGTTIDRRIGTPPPRIMEVAGGIIASVGLENPGAKKVVEEVVPEVSGYDSPIIANLGGATVEDYVEAARILDACDDIDAIEINISCPNVKNGCLAFGGDPEVAGKVTSEVRAVTDKTLLVKLTPAVTDITVIAKSVEACGADALTMVNAYPAMGIDINTRKPFIGNVRGGLCGPALKPIALLEVYNTAQVVDIPIIGLGGIICWQDAVEYLLAGATAVGIGTGNMLDPATTMKVIDGIEGYLVDNGFDDVNDIIGLAWKES